jgi:hypothetical protein
MYIGERYFILNSLEPDFRDIGEFMNQSHSQEMVPSISNLRQQYSLFANTSYLRT